MAPRPYDTTAWRKARKEAVQQSGGRCRICKVKRKRLHVHHSIGVGKDPDHRKLEVLCASCHEIVEIGCRRKATPYKRCQWLLLYSQIRRKLEAKATNDREQ